jgi:hypothetical protein
VIDNNIMNDECIVNDDDILNDECIVNDDVGNADLRSLRNNDTEKNIENKNKQNLPEWQERTKMILSKIMQ